ncbi:MAG TPA: ATP-binding protein, partial [Gammaproteobacteria bacterium]|nr:ATP-binding protein [Gammaproteobacteria bacterium]
TAMIAETGDRWRNRLEDGGLALSVDLPEVAVEINADERRLQQLLDNLLENSLRYTERGGRVRVGLTVGDGGAVVSLEDSAPGVPEEALQRLFERLYRVEVSRSRESGGAGLGLAICRNIARAHGGEVEAYASPLGGLGIRVTLPLAG